MDWFEESATQPIITIKSNGEVGRPQHGSPGGLLPIMAYTGRLRPKGVPFSSLRYKKG